MNELHDFEKHFFPETVVTIVVELADHSLYEGTAVIKTIQGDHVGLELAAPLPQNVSPYAKVIITTIEGWAFCRCQGFLLEKSAVEVLKIRLAGPVDVQQRREYFREDVLLPILWSVPEEQQLAVVRQEWDLLRVRATSDIQPVMVPSPRGFKVIHWRKRMSINPVRINLSGSGLGFPTDKCLIPGTLVNLQLFLPINPPRVIMAVGVVIRSDEVLQSTGKASHMTALHFELLDERDRETIISYLFMAQRNLLRQKADERADEEFPPTEPEEVE